MRQVIAGVLAALLSTLIILGSLSLTVAESGFRIAQAPVFTSTPGLAGASDTPQPVQPGEQPSPLPSLTPTSPPWPDCPPPEGWVSISPSPDETLASLAQTYGISVEKMMEANCTVTASLPLVNVTVNVPASLPATPTATATPAPPPSPTRQPPPPPTATRCPPVPANWVPYTVRRGDTLYSLGVRFHVSWTLIMQVNCLSSTNIRGGQVLYVPYVPTPLPSPTPVAPTNTTQPHPTGSPLPRPTNTSPPADTPTPPPEPTQTPSPQPPKPTDTQPPRPTDTQPPEPTDTPSPDSASPPKDTLLTSVPDQFIDGTNRATVMGRIPSR